MITESPTTNQGLFTIQPNPDGAEAFDSMKEIFELVAAGLYSLAAMLVGEGEESARLVEETIASAQVSPCADPQNARRCSRRALAAAALKLLAERCPGCLAAPQGLVPATTCIEGDDLASAGISTGELESMMSGTGARAGAGVAGQFADMDADGFCAARGGRVQRGGDGRAAEAARRAAEPPHGRRRR